MEVIAKQIAFLSKETAQHQPKPSSNTQSRDDDSRSSGSLQGLSTTVAKGDHQAKPSKSTEEEVSAQSTPLAARLELYERLRQSRATSDDLFPAKVLQVSVPTMLPLLAHPTGLDADSASRTIAFSAGSAIPHRVDQAPPPGTFHQFIRHVRPFSLCPDSGSTGTRLEDTLPSHHQADHLTPPEPTGAASKARMAPTGSPGGGGCVQETAEDTPNSHDYSPGGRSPVVQGTGEEPRWTRLPGLSRRKRKERQTHSDPATTEDGSDSDLAPTVTKSHLACHSLSPSDNGAPSSKRGEQTNKTSARTRSRASKPKARRTDGVFRTFSRRAAIEFRRHQEEGVQHAPPLQTTINRKATRGGGRGIRPAQISLPMWSTGIRNANSSMGTLNLAHPDVHVDIPEIKNPGDYLASIVSPSRSLPSMKRSFQQRSRSFKHLQDNRAQRSGSPQRISGVAKEMEKINANEGGDVDTRGDLWAPPTELQGDETPTEPRGEANSTADISLPLPLPGVDTERGETGSATCMIDLRSIWRRSGAISQSILQAVKVNETRGSIISNLRESIARLDSEHRTQAEGGQGRMCSRRRQGALDYGSGGTIFHQDGMTKLILSLQNAVPGDRETFGVGESPQEARNTRMFTLIVSLAHVHNISCHPKDRGTSRGDESYESPPSQLHLSLSEQWTDVVVTARDA